MYPEDITLEGSVKGLYFDESDDYTFISVERGYFFDLYELSYSSSPKATFERGEFLVCPMEYLV